jgi:3-hydroxyacyl-[acyl-carrier-protein] dehydratase
MRWMWIDTIVTYEPDKRLVAIKNVSLAEEHLHEHFRATATLPAQPVMPASLMIEGMAQTAGILVGSLRRFKEKVVLAKIQRAEINADVIPGQCIRYDARIERIAVDAARRVARAAQSKRSRTKVHAPMLAGSSWHQTNFAAG